MMCLSRCSITQRSARAQVLPQLERMTLSITMVNLKTWTILEHEAKAVKTIHRIRIGSMATIRGKDWERKFRAKTEQFIKEDSIPRHVRLCYREGREPIPYAPLVSVWSWQQENKINIDLSASLSRGGMSSLLLASLWWGIGFARINQTWSLSSMDFRLDDMLNLTHIKWGC